MEDSEYLDTLASLAPAKTQEELVNDFCEDMDNIRIRIHNARNKGYIKDLEHDKITKSLESLGYTKDKINEMMNNGVIDDEMRAVLIAHYDLKN
jgi:hypothetical protein